MSDIDLEDHIVDESTERIEIESNGDTLWFDIRELSGYEITQIEDRNIDIDETGQIDMSTDDFRLDMLREKIVDTNVPKLPVFLKRCNDDVYDELVSFVDNPLDTDENEGN